MKKLLVMMSFALLAGLAWGASSSYEDQVAERLKPVGDVCVKGKACETATVAASESQSSGPRSGEEVFKSVCSACHSSGVMGAPKFGNAEDWAPRIAEGKDTLYEHALNGFNSMPAKGGNASLSDEEVKAAVDHMVAAAQ